MTTTEVPPSSDSEQRWDEKIVGGVIHHHSWPEPTALIASLGDIPKDSYVDVHFYSLDDGTSFAPQPPIKGATWKGIAMALDGSASMAVLESADFPMPVIVPVTRLQAILVKWMEITAYEVRPS